MRQTATRWLDAATSALGSITALIIAVSAVLLWAVFGPVAKFSEPWQLVANTATTLVTFVMVFVIQNTANRSDRAMHAKLDEILRVLGEADNHLVGIEDMAEADIREMQDKVRAEADPTV